MIERKLFQDTFSALHASEKSIQEVLAMSEEKKNTAARFRRPRRALLTAAAVMASLWCLWPRRQCRHGRSAGPGH